MDNKLTDYVLRHSKKRDKELRYDFMPSLLEIIERPAHKAGTVIIVSVFSLLIVAIIWACLSKMDVVVTSTGSLQPAGDLKVVQSYTGGIVNAINTTEGAYVNEGDVLIVLDTTSLDIDENQLSYQKLILEKQQELYQKIKNKEDVSDLNIEEYEEGLKTYIQAILDADASYRNTLLNLENEKKNAELNHQIAQIQMEEYEISGTGKQVEMQKLIISQYELAVEKAELEINDTITQYSMQINTKLSEIAGQLEEIRANIEKYNLSKKYQNVTAPVSGYINSMDVNTIGETVTAAQELITIVPDDTPLEMVCYVQNMDIADVEIGMEAEIKFEAYPYNKYGTAKGTVTYISSSAFVSETLGSVYLVKVEIRDENEAIKLISGLSGTVEIKIGKRTVMEYFLDPIIKGFGESLKEK